MLASGFYILWNPLRFISGRLGIRWLVGGWELGGWELRAQSTTPFVLVRIRNGNGSLLSGLLHKVGSSLPLGMLSLGMLPLSMLPLGMLSDLLGGLNFFKFLRHCLVLTGHIPLFLKACRIVLFLKVSSRIIGRSRRNDRISYSKLRLARAF